MILDVSGAFVGDFQSGKLGENVFQRLSAHVGLKISRRDNY
jgi:hypothetical protein